MTSCTHLHQKKMVATMNAVVIKSECNGDVDDIEGSKMIAIVR